MAPNKIIGIDLKTRLYQKKTWFCVIKICQKDISPQDIVYSSA